MKEDLGSLEIIKLVDSLGLSEYLLEKVEEGVSTNVYKLISPRESLYLRILNSDESVLPQVKAHELFLDRGLRVPKVHFHGEFSEMLGKRSFMVVSEVGGRSLEKEGVEKSDLKKILFEAGREIATINSIEASGFGFIERVEERIFSADTLTYSELMFQELDSYMALIKETMPESFPMVQKHFDIIQKNASYFENAGSYLNHGDFDSSHIYALDGKYSGIIDFGDLKGASQLHDLAHYKIYSGSEIDLLLEGYHSVIPATEDFNEKLELECSIFAINAIGKGLVKGRERLIRLGVDYMYNLENKLDF